MCISMHQCQCIYASLCMHGCMYACLYVCMHIGMAKCWTCKRLRVDVSSKHGFVFDQLLSSWHKCEATRGFLQGQRSFLGRVGSASHEKPETLLWCWTATPSGASSSVSFPRRWIGSSAASINLGMAGYGPSLVKMLLDGKFERWLILCFNKERPDPKVLVLEQWNDCVPCPMSQLLLVTSASFFEHFITWLTRAYAE